MKAFIAIVFVVGVFGLATAAAADEAAKTPSAAQTSRLPGVDLAQGISEITGAGISPLLGVSAVGAWRYYHSPDAMRASLPWFCHPAFWGSAFVLLALCLLKDVIGSVAPPLVKKPFDMAELFESKVSALVASTAFVPIIASQIAEHFATAAPQTSAAISTGVHYASVLPIGALTLDLRWLLIPLFLVSFLVVWMTGHAINVLIALCPFGIIDSLLKLVKTALLAMIVLSYAITPYLGAAVSLVIILVAAWFAPAAFRLTVFGTLFAADTILPARGRRLATPAEPHAFAGATAGVPSRTYGRIVRGPDGSVQFSFRPWLLLPRRTITLPAGTLALSKGIYYPSLLHSSETSTSFTRIILFLPRYRTQEQALAEYLEITDIRDSALTKGFKAVRAWLSEIASLGKSRYVETPQIGNG